MSVTPFEAHPPENEQVFNKTKHVTNREQKEQQNKARYKQRTKRGVRFFINKKKQNEVAAKTHSLILNPAGLVVVIARRARGEYRERSRSGAQITKAGVLRGDVWGEEKNEKKPQPTRIQPQAPWSLRADECHATNKYKQTNTFSPQRSLRQRWRRKQEKHKTQKHLVSFCFWLLLLLLFFCVAQHVALMLHARTSDFRFYYLKHNNRKES